MSIVAEYGAAHVRGNGCGSGEAGAAMFLDSGGATAGNRSECDAYRFPLAGYSPAHLAAPSARTRTASACA